MDADRLFNWGLVLLVVFFAGMLLSQWLGLAILFHVCVIGLLALGVLAWVVMMMNAPW